MDVIEGRTRAEKIDKLQDKMEQDDELKFLKQEFHDQETYLFQLINRINDRRKTRNEYLKVHEYQQKENTLVFLDKELNDLLREKEGIEKVLKKQEKDLNVNDANDAKKQRVELDNKDKRHRN